MSYFNLWIRGRELLVKPTIANIVYKIYENRHLIASSRDGEETLIRINERKPDTKISIEYFMDNKLYRECYPLKYFYATRVRDYQPGDILVASDNVKTELTGYMGHAAIVVNENELVEAPGTAIAIVRESIQQFLAKHPLHAQFRPVQSKLGQQATQYAIDYHQTYMKNLENGIQQPTFSFTLAQQLDDPWDKIYCSKLVWLCYHYGADYTFENDHLWFSPEDLYHQLLENKDFEIIYQHEEVEFLIDL
ncbi:hypothetical protein SH601_04285 [Gracilibacillus sp. S3-1-1]|uniref:Uncharacterized protein n=1 Tax=Gracilibacillus pellucidus TaxID=3095368 RepID=A0ACC6M2P4_9BACI|nr:hypothetical protein [Gracilibacillus sp. S3-1-1]MDX8045199.1 hypothetical protein [Gracilibacillus sp. S3-1-1]